jgi:Flp pilus assembly protein TadD
VIRGPDAAGRARPAVWGAAVLAAALLGCSSRWFQRPPTFARDVAPIVFANCAPCHRAGQLAPFALTTFAEARSRARAIGAAVRERRMPPWLPDPGNPSFAGERRLEPHAIATIERWAAAGAPEGDPADLPALPSWSPAWQLGAPDLVAAMPAPYTLPPTAGHDVYRNVVLRLSLSAARFVRAIEFQPGDAPIHHAVIRVDRQRASRSRDGEDGQPGFDGMAAYDVQDPDGHFLGWAPGRGPIVAPPGLPWILDPQSDLVVELHLMPRPTQATVQPSVGLYFTEKGPDRTPVMIVMGSKAIDIPAGARDYAVEDRYTLPVDAEALSVYPHAHYLGREMAVDAFLPDGSAHSLIHIRRWSFNWQQDYRFTTPVALPRGTILTMRYTYDNSAENTSNPHKPPRRVTWGPQSHDEMANLGIQLLTRTAGQSRELGRSFAQHAALIDVAGAEMLTRVDPDNATNAALLGTSYMRVGRYSEAVPALERALRLAPESAANENHLGGALLGAGRQADALVHFRRAVALAPRDAHLRFNLAKVLSATRHGSEALDQYERALALDPAFAEAHQHIGVMLFAAGRLTNALDHLARAAELAPASPAIHADLGGALAQAGRLEEAGVHLRRALQLDPGNATARDNLARLDRLTAR